jgi:ABC-type transporter Mla subunit MlaD
MNIDDRLEALTQSLELLASMHRDSEKRMEQITQNVERVSENVERQSNNVDRLSLATERNTQGNARLEDLVTQIAEGTARLLHVAEVHERRISDLEGN